MKIRRRSKRRFVYKNEVIAGLVILLAALLIFFGIKALLDRAVPAVTLSVDNVVIRQDEELPEVQVKVQYDEKEAKTILNSKTGYTLGDLVNEINAGNGYQVEHDADIAKEGNYTIRVKLDKELQAKLSPDWKKKISLSYTDGILEVKSKYGDWEGNKFKMTDGTYASGWMNIGDDTYYFGEDGLFITGECEIGGKTYYFGEDGKFDTEKNKINPNRPIIALTFDDGPGLYTEMLLNALEENGAKATFFMLGTRVKSYPEAVQKMVEIGCEIGNHTTNHARLTDLNATEINSEIEGTNQALQNVVKQTAKYVRPPYGAVNSVVRATVKSPLIMWSLDTLDWQSKNVEKIKEVVLSSVKDGDIVLMHDIHETTVQAVIELLPELKEKGYQFLTISELAELRGVTLKNGEKYFNFYN